MDEYPFGSAGHDLGPFSLVSYLLAFALALTTCLLSFSDMSQQGPEVGAIVSFDPAEGPRQWDQPGIPARYASAAPSPQSCVLVPSLIAAGGGSFVVEAKQTTVPPTFRVHWSGRRTDNGTQDCGRSADLTLALPQLRALANVAGGFGVEHGFFGL